MRFLPKKRPQALRAKIESWRSSQIDQKLQEDAVSVIAVRGYYLDSMGKKEKNDRGIYDDAAFIISPESFLSFNFNTDPSGYKQGRASLESPQIVDYVQGHHGYGKKSGHTAFRQASSVVVRRDGGEGNGKRIEGTDSLFHDRANLRFWINLHRGGYTTTSSAGCQTVPPEQWQSFFTTLQMLMKRHNQNSFQYHLINEPRIKDPKNGFWYDGEYK
tara:strand:+ start:14121 stop:14768 length:648 start_codon:yes stop_codon:yes gene_type:complete